MREAQTKFEAPPVQGAPPARGTGRLRCTVAIPTFRRPERLRAAIASVRNQTGTDADEFEILVVDNSPEGSAACVVRAFPPEAPALRYVHELKSGPAHARNRAVAEARGPLLAFLDDDETAAPAWLSSLIQVLEGSRADAAFGKVEASFDLAPTRHGAYAERLYTRTFNAESGADLCGRHAGLGTGNSIFRVATCFAGTEPFPVEVAAAGGEDTVFLRRLVKSGRRFAWAPDAIVEEHVPADRVRPDSLRARRYRQGQLRALACLEGPHPSLAGLLFWMAVGLAQALKAGATRLLWRILGQNERGERAEFEVAGGLGKVTWWMRSPTLYGPTARDDGDHPLRPKTQNFS